MTMRAQCTKGAFANALSGRAALGGGQPCARLALGFGDLARAHVLGDFGAAHLRFLAAVDRSEEHRSELQSLMRISYAVFYLKKKKVKKNIKHDHNEYTMSISHNTIT